METTGSSSPPQSLPSCSSQEIILSHQPPAISFPLPLSDAFLHPHYRPGDLHLVPCTLDQYLDLPYHAEDRYELVQGILVWESDMGDKEHDEAIERMAAELYRANCAGKDNDWAVVTSRSVHISDKPTATHRSLKSATIRRPDIAICNGQFEAERGRLSPKSERISFPRGYPPDLVVEYTSTGSSRERDLGPKQIEYESVGVKTYVIVDRDLPSRKGEKVIVYQLPSDSGSRRPSPSSSRRESTTASGSYRRSVYHGTDPVDCPFFENVGFTAEQVLRPPRTVKEALDSPLKKEKGRADKLQGELHKEKGRADKLQGELHKEKGRADRYATLLRRHGIDVDDDMDPSAGKRPVGRSPPSGNRDARYGGSSNSGSPSQKSPDKKRQKGSWMGKGHED